MKMNLYRIKLQIRCYCKGIYTYADATITIPAFTEMEAISKVKNTEFEITNIESKLIELS